MPQEETELGQFIPLHYHFHMLKDRARVEPFKAAIEKFSRPGCKVLELGGGTGVLSWFAAQTASKVYCVERNPEMAAAARRFLAMNSSGERVTVIDGDAANYVPPEPVDLVICEMLHTGLIREKQLEVIDAFKKNYKSAFPTSPLPRLLPEAAIQAIQPIQENFVFYGYQAPIPLFEDPAGKNPDSVELGDPVVYQTLDYRAAYSLDIVNTVDLPIKVSGKLNSVRIILKNLVALIVSENRSIDWHCSYIILPLAAPIEVKAGETLRAKINYRAGCSFAQLQGGITISPQC